MAKNSAGECRTEMRLTVERPPNRDDGPPKFLEAHKRLRRTVGGGTNGKEASATEVEVVLRAELVEGVEPINIRYKNDITSIIF